MWRLSGIFRDVFLYATPSVHLFDYFIESKLDEQYQDATLRIKPDGLVLWMNADIFKGIQYCFKNNIIFQRAFF